MIYIFWLFDIWYVGDETISYIEKLKCMAFQNLRVFRNEVMMVKFLLRFENRKAEID